MDIKIVDPHGEEVKSENVEIKDPVAPIGDVPPDDMYQHEIAKLFGIEDKQFSKYQTDFKTLVDYAKSQTTDHSPENLKWIIRSLELKLGTPHFGEDRVKFITRYAYLLKEEHRINDEKKKFEQL